MTNRASLQERRLAELDLLVQIEGRASNERLRKLFKLARAQPSRLLAAYREWSPRRLVREGSAWVLHPSSKPDPLEARTLDAYRRLVTQEWWFEDARVDFTSVDARLFRTLRGACLARCGVDVVYSSLSSESTTERRLYPQRIVRVGRRLHTRAWCPLHRQYRDYVMSRMGNARLSPDLLPRGAGEDREWTTTVSAQLKPHPALSVAAAKIVEAEMDGAQGRRMDVRAALLKYVLLEMQVAIDTDRELPPRFQLALANAEKLRPYLLNTRAGAKR